MKRALGGMALAVALGLAAAGCASSVAPGGNGTTPSAPGLGGSPSPIGAPVTFRVWLSMGDHLFVTERGERTTDPTTAALRALVAGPSAVETDAGVGTAVPAGTELRAVTVQDGVAIVDLSRAFESGGGSVSMMMRLAQVVYTATQSPDVQSVEFRLDGQPVTVFSGEGLILEHPVTRQTYQDLLPAILVEGPRIGEQVSSPVTISGTADVFEAVVSIRILNANGDEIASANPMATCGTGCRGSFRVDVAYTVATEQPGTVMAYEASAKDGSPINVVRIPVILTP